MPNHPQDQTTGKRPSCLQALHTTHSLACLVDLVLVALLSCCVRHMLRKDFAEEMSKLMAAVDPF
jgi:hypothetical protein